MAEIKSFGTEYDVTRKTLKSSAKFKLADSVSVRMSAAEPSARCRRRSMRTRRQQTSASLRIA